MDDDMHSEIKTYAKHWKRHLNAMEKTRQVLFKKALDDAAKIANYLRERYGCEEIYLIGSILEKERFSEKSDIDLVVRGLPKERYFHILAEIRDITDFSTDIIPYEDANELIIETVKKEGKRL
ncbi:MAG: hypothetical protein A2Z60_02160 [Nitrospirae bacterium RIFCSPLOWO2_02_42_7]|nr:MAG: hypothetical protein A2Z60_02160 [Nitrospirae bacterium RIFCSPLOWO2_02_42_7]HAS16867.1 hypothetical protein [Nitrospiraceae bacterium]